MKSYLNERDRWIRTEPFELKRSKIMKQGFIPISIEKYLNLYFKHNKDQDRKQLTEALDDVLSAYKHGVKCACGNPIWVIGSALSGYACFTCITGEAYPEDDYEIDEACDSDASQESDIDRFRFEQVSEILRKHPDNYVEKLEEVGFQWFDDDAWEEEEEEERAAVPQTENQRALVAFFEEGGPLTHELLDAFRTEKYADEPNYPLFRRYFKQINGNFKKLVLWGLDRYPTDSGLLDDLSFFEEFDNVLSELINRYKTACLQEKDLDRFDSLAQDFYMSTIESGFDAYYELKEMFEKNAEKKHIIDRQIAELRKSEDELPYDIPFLPGFIS